MTQQQSISIENNITEVATAMDSFEAFAEQHGISAGVTMKINIVLDEIISNIIKYGFPDKSKQLLEIAFELVDSKLVLKISDNGVPFNPFQTTPPNFAVPLEEREIGGLGIHLVRQLMDEYSYDREAEKNILTMTKKQLF